MGCVGTLPEFRHRGLIRTLVNEFHKRVASHGYDLSVIEGIPYFYRQFGYEYAIPLDEEITIRLDQIPDYELKHVIRPFTERDVPKAMQLLKQAQQKFYVHSVRDKQIWKMQHETGMASSPNKFEGYTVEEKGEMGAYIRVGNEPKDKALILREVTETDQLTAKSILRFLKDLGKQRGFETLSAQTSCYEPFAEHLATIGALKHVPPYAWQIRVTDYVKLFKKMKPLFEKRLAESTYRYLTEKLNFNFRRHTVQMNVENGIVKDVQHLETNEDRTIGLNPLVFVQLLLDYRSLSELEMIYPDFRIRPSHKHLIDVLFPKLPSYIHAVY
jgi:predicted acetyltransferase